MKTCLRPMPSTTAGPLNRAAMRVNDPVICQCGSPHCRDADLPRKERA